MVTDTTGDVPLVRMASAGRSTRYENPSLRDGYLYRITFDGATVECSDGAVAAHCRPAAEGPRRGPQVRGPSGSGATRAWIASASTWICRVRSVLRWSSCSCATKSWSAFACWNIACRF